MISEKAKAWQNRPLSDIYTICYLDATFFKMRSEGAVTKTAVYAVMGITLEGNKECLGLWISTGGESAKYWLGILNELKHRGVQDILIFCVDNLPGLSEALATAYPQAEVQKCIVHMVRNSLKHVGWKERKAVAADLKLIYRASSEDAGLQALEAFGVKWDKKYPHISASWIRNWDELSTFFKYPEEVRRLIYTTNPIESFNSRIKKVTRNKGSFPDEDSLRKLLYLIVDDVSKKWTGKVRSWGTIFGQLSIYFEKTLKKYVE